MIRAGASMARLMRGRRVAQRLAAAAVRYGEERRGSAQHDGPSVNETQAESAVRVPAARSSRRRAVKPRRGPLFALPLERDQRRKVPRRMPQKVKHARI